MVLYQLNWHYWKDWNFWKVWTMNKQHWTERKNLKFATLLVDNCLLTGSIPTHFGLLTSLRRLLLWANRLTGALPTELGKLTSLAHISVGTATPLFKNKFYHCIVCIYRFEWFIVAVANRARFIEELGVFTLG